MRISPVPTVSMMGSETPVVLTRFSMIVRMTPSSVDVGAPLPPVSTPYLISNPPLKSKPSFVCGVTKPALGLVRLKNFAPLPGPLGPGMKSMNRAIAPMTRIRIGTNRRTRGDVSRDAGRARGRAVRGAAPGVGGSRKCALPLPFQTRLDLRRQRGSDSRHRRDLLRRRLADALGRAEDTQQRGPTLGSHTRQVVESGASRCLGSQRAVVRDCEAMGLVAEPLHQVERRGRRGQ